MITPFGAMSLAIDEAKKGFGYVEPNPPVGCVILDQHGELLAKGYHRRFGGDHAEIDALNKIEDFEKLKGAVLYVTLEPCAHVGKTPACAVRLAQLPLKKVVYGLEDPHKLVNGEGLRILSTAGIEVEQYQDLTNELEDLAEVFLWNKRRHLPFVALKVATSLDGRMAFKSGESQWITGEESREYVHVLRARYDAVLIGKRTFIQDHPKLNVRHERYPEKKNKVVLLDGRSQLVDRIQESPLFQAHNPQDIFLVVGDGVSVPKTNIQIVKTPLNDHGEIHIPSLLPKLDQCGIHSLFVEGGARVLSSFMSEKSWQRLYQFIAPQLIGSGGINYSEGFAIGAWDQRIRLKSVQHRVLGSDILITGKA